MVIRYITEHFSYEDFTCKCCQRLKINDRLYEHVERLEEMRGILGFPIIINSGYRCVEHNREVGGGIKSQHLYFATDIRPSWGNGFSGKLRIMYALTKELKFDGIGRYQSFIHIDLRGKIARWGKKV